MYIICTKYLWALDMFSFLLLCVYSRLSIKVYLLIEVVSACMGKIKDWTQCQD
jgi:hypothetical protein